MGKVKKRVVFFSQDDKSGGDFQTVSLHYLRYFHENTLEKYGLNSKSYKWKANPFLKRKKLMK